MEHLNSLDVIDAFVLRYGHRLSAIEMSDLLGISCEELNQRYNNLFFIHVACQTDIDKEYHKRCTKLLKGFPPVVRAEGLLRKQHN